MTSFSHSSSPVARGTRANGEPRPVGVFFKAASARKLVGWFAGPAEIAENPSSNRKPNCVAGQRFLVDTGPLVAPMSKRDRRH